MGATHYDAIIVGGGVIGCAIAYYMTQEGAKVLLLEQERIAAGASSAAAGMLGAQAELIESRPLLELALRSRSLFPSVAEQLKAWSGIDIGLQRKGLLRVARTAQEAAMLKAAAAEQRKLGEQADWPARPNDLRQQARARREHRCSRTAAFHRLRAADVPCQRRMRAGANNASAARQDDLHARLLLGAEEGRRAADRRYCYAAFI